jgi:hypothetical protein
MEKKMRVGFIGGMLGFMKGRERRQLASFGP